MLPPKSIARKLSPELLPVLVVLLLYGLAFLPRIGQFGFYKDDWYMIYHGHTYGAHTITDSFLIDRPVMGQINRGLYLILRDSPLAWNLFAFAVRFAEVLAFYVLMRILWPAQRFAAAAMAALFAVYPGFLQQPNAATFLNHFIGYGLALYSILFSLVAFQTRGGLRGLLILLSLVCTAGYLWIYEYMLGLELLRFSALVFMARRGSDRAAIRTAWLRYLPNFAVVAVFLVWRFFFFSSDRPATNAEAIGAGYLADPSGALARMTAGGFQDLIETVWLSWSAPLYLVWQKAELRELAIGVLLAALAGMAWWWYARRSASQPTQPAQTDWTRSALILGLLGVLGALAPVVLAGRSVYFGDQFDRYTLHATAGVALMTGAFFFRIFQGRVLLVASTCLLGMSVMVHFLNATQWAELWSIQRAFWWQTAWRAPMLSDGAILMARLPQGYRLAEDYEVFSPANLVYHPEEKLLRIYGEVLNDSTASNVVAQTSYSYRYIRYFELKRDFRKTIIADWRGGESCVHWIDGTRPELSAGSDAVLYWTAPYSRIELIQPGAPDPKLLPTIFGPEPDRNSWCYLYQKAAWPGRAVIGKLFCACTLRPRRPTCPRSIRLSGCRSTRLSVPAGIQPRRSGLRMRSARITKPISVCAFWPAAPVGAKTNVCARPWLLRINVETNFHGSKKLQPAGYFWSRTHRSGTKRSLGSFLR